MKTFKTILAAVWLMIGSMAMISLFTDPMGTGPIEMIVFGLAMWFIFIQPARSLAGLR